MATSRMKPSANLSFEQLTLSVTDVSPSISTSSFVLVDVNGDTITVKCCLAGFLTGTKGLGRMCSTSGLVDYRISLGDLPFVWSRFCLLSSDQ